jgi:hypothetical protein
MGTISMLHIYLNHLSRLVLIAGFLSGCASLNSITHIVTPEPPLILPQNDPSTSESHTYSLSDEEVATLRSLKKIDDYPLYTMHYYGSYDQGWISTSNDRDVLKVDLVNPELPAWPTTWACSLFAALGDADNRLYGRNFDWEHSPAILLFTNPPDGYASVSMVDMAYLGFSGTRADTIIDLPLIELEALLNAPFIPFDGMNEQGLVVGMAAVPPGDMLPDPDKETVDSVMIIRLMLDLASNVDEAVAILESYNIDMGVGPPIHYLITDSSGQAALVEFYQGEMVVIPNETPWHLATNFLRAAYGESVDGISWRYDTIFQRLSDAEGLMTSQEAIDLLENVSQRITQWSVVYGMSTGDVIVIMERQYGNVYTFNLNIASQ